MPAACPLVPVFHALRSNGSRPSEDRIFVTENAVIILDGASQPEKTTFDGGWIASTLGSKVAACLCADPASDLSEILENAIRCIVKDYDLQPGASPSTTVAMVRWDTTKVDVLVLCDSPVIVADHGGKIHPVRDDRLTVEGHARRNEGIYNENHENWQALVTAERKRRNTLGGYWVAEAVPEAAHHAVKASFPLDEVAVILAMTDGISRGVDRYGVPPDWTTALTIAKDNPARLMNMIHAAEMSDPDGERWPRSKRHDDKALAVVRFDLCQS
jgi:hypothetical protein